MGFALKSGDYKPAALTATFHPCVRKHAPGDAETGVSGVDWFGLVLLYGDDLDSLRDLYRMRVALRHAPSRPDEVTVK